MKKHHKDFVVTELKREYNEYSGQFYIRMELMRKRIWLRAHSIFSEQQLAELNWADEYLLPRRRKKTKDELQGVLW